MQNKPLREAVQDDVIASRDEGMYQLFSDRLSQKMVNLSNPNVTDMYKG